MNSWVEAKITSNRDREIEKLQLRIKELEAKIEEAKKLLYMVSHGRIESKKINHFLFELIFKPEPAEEAVKEKTPFIKGEGSDYD